MATMLPPVRMSAVHPRGVTPRGRLLDKLVNNLGSSLPLDDAAAQLKVNITDLAEAYEKALSPIDC